MKKIDLFLCTVLFATAFFTKTSFSEEFSSERLVTYVRPMLLEREHKVSLGLGISAGSHRGMGLMIETRDRVSNEPAFAATIAFVPAPAQSSTFWSPGVTSTVEVEYVAGRNYFSREREYPQSQSRYLTTDPLESSASPRDTNLIRRLPPTTIMEGENRVSDFYEKNLKSCFSQFTVPAISFSGLKSLLSDMRTELDTAGQRTFPKFTKSGFSLYNDSINCIGFCLRLMHHHLDLRIPRDSLLAVYLNHDYIGTGFFGKIGGWGRVRFSQDIKSLKLERYLENLFFADGDGVRSSIPDMKLIDIVSEEGRTIRNWETSIPTILALVRVREPDVAGFFGQNIRLPLQPAGESPPQDQVLVRKTVVGDIIQKIRARDLSRNERVTVHPDWICVRRSLIEDFLERLLRISNLRYRPSENLLPNVEGVRLIWALEKTELGMTDLFRKFGEDAILGCWGTDFDSTVVREPIYTLINERDIGDLFKRFGRDPINVERVGLIEADRFGT